VGKERCYRFCAFGMLRLPINPVTRYGGHPIPRICREGRGIVISPYGRKKKKGGKAKHPQADKKKRTKRMSCPGRKGKKGNTARGVHRIDADP